MGHDMLALGIRGDPLQPGLEEPISYEELEVYGQDWEALHRQDVWDSQAANNLCLYEYQHSAATSVLATCPAVASVFAKASNEYVLAVLEYPPFFSQEHSSTRTCIREYSRSHEYF
ncbi:hypothetical protein SISSUDRAFT_1067981 [Sistotremastrum suecicum HHB10207 ss-3]|uniref:Uncharacterized protein n=1 Tax=Sistotremastrum suecicum HHB10207 ss-3 TaxID=1314776 RepID=A0A165WIK7_9AGAM|nr:hypothetical protein SISSUDRAFT_1067981 [Sistotremastrum suecicum HHB10207 ss-3]